MSGLGTIVGIGEADGGRATGRRGVELAAEASLRAVDDAGIESRPSMDSSSSRPMSTSITWLIWR